MTRLPAPPEAGRPKCIIQVGRTADGYVAKVLDLESREIVHVGRPQREELDARVAAGLWVRRTYGKAFPTQRPQRTRRQG